ncbi:MAG: NAD+ synthase [Alphaproteobacteria bacterium]|nr:NAD+ synthase [Alphaproteobacteria bacterium]
MTNARGIAIAQLNPTVGDIDGNVRRILDARAKAASDGAELMVASELGVIGYPPEDLVLRPVLVERAAAGVAVLAAATGDGGPALIVGSTHREDGKLYNAAFLLDGGKIAATRLKHALPNYGVFDEKRVFAQGALPGPVPFRGARLGLMICEDMWYPDVTECLEESGAEILIVINGSPFEQDKDDERLNLAVARITESGLPLLYVNQVGGQDELVFDGASFVLDAECRLKAHATAWREDVLTTRWTPRADGRWTCEATRIAKADAGEAAIYRAMVLGLADYVGKNRFKGVLIALSGGIDSALTAAVAVDALGADKVHCVMMPSRFTARDSLDDAAACARALGCELSTIPIEPAVAAFGTMLRDSFAGRGSDTTEENIQARVRGIALMGLSNKFGQMVVSTGNKSEMSVGYATLYGDMCGGFSVLKDVYKTTVYRLSDWRNAHRPEGLLGPEGRVIPEHVITRAPTAELRPNQTDQDSLPPYAVLDDILHGLVEKELSFAEVAARGHDEALVRKVWAMLVGAEYKRRQAPPGVKITRRAFGRDRRYPITNAFRG